MTNPIKIAVDCMSGDLGAAVNLPACANALRKHAALHLVLVGDAALINASRSKWDDALQARSEVFAASEVVSMEDSPQHAYRKKRDSSMRKAIDLVNDGAVHAAVSSGNTGALAMTAMLVLRPIDGLERAAIATYLPTKSEKPVLMLDLGANAQCSAEHLLQFGVMGAALASADGRSNPSVGLLNIGEELGKGNDTYKTAYELLDAQKAQGLNFVGNIEGTDIFKGVIDVVVCDGFVGNIALKTSEGLASMIKEMLTKAFTQNLATKALALLAYPVLALFKRKMDHRRHNGAVLLGLNGLVVKSHGSADKLAFACAIERAFIAAQSDITGRLKQAFNPA